MRATKPSCAPNAKQDSYSQNTSPSPPVEVGRGNDFFYKGNALASTAEVEQHDQQIGVIHNAVAVKV